MFACYKTSEKIFINFGALKNPPIKKSLFIITAILINGYTMAQTVKGGKVNTESAKLTSKLDTGKKPEGWTIRGTNTYCFKQAVFSNWVAGGINAIAPTSRADYQFNLKRGKNLWENRILGACGLHSEQKSAITNGRICVRSNLQIWLPIGQK